MRENMDQKNSEYEQVLRSVNVNNSLFSLKQSGSSIVIEDCEYGKVRVYHM